MITIRTFFSKFFHQSFENLNADEFKERYRKSKASVLIDVRTPQEFKQGTIKGARNINYMTPSFEETVRSLDKSKSYFLFCRSGGRSRGACAKMAEAGFKVVNLKGGFSSWRD